MENLKVLERIVEKNNSYIRQIAAEESNRIDSNLPSSVKQIGLSLETSEVITQIITKINGIVEGYNISAENKVTLEKDEVLLKYQAYDKFAEYLVNREIYTYQLVSEDKTKNELERLLEGINNNAHAMKKCDVNVKDEIANHNKLIYQLVYIFKGYQLANPSLELLEDKEITLKSGELIYTYRININ